MPQRSGYARFELQVGNIPHREEDVLLNVGERLVFHSNLVHCGGPARFQPTKDVPMSATAWTRKLRSSKEQQASFQQTSPPRE